MAPGEHGWNCWAYSLLIGCPPQHNWPWVGISPIQSIPESALDSIAGLTDPIGYVPMGPGGSELWLPEAVVVS